MKAWVDVKYDNVIEECKRRGWDVTIGDGSASQSDGGRPTIEVADLFLVWANLRSVDFDNVALENPTLLLNHFRGAHHWSNKAFLSYHMWASGFDSDMPCQWSAAYQDLTDLLFLVTSYTLCAAVCPTLPARASGSESPRLEAAPQEDVPTCDRLLKALLMDPELAATEKMASLQAVVVAWNRHLRDQNQASQAAVAEAVASHRAVTGLDATYGERGVWIVKPVGSSNGQGITLVSGVRDLLSLVEQWGFKCVVQKYIERPLLVRQSRKFDIRQWVLITKLEPLVFYGYSEFYCRLSRATYSCEAAKLGDLYVHLTNHAVQIEGEGEGEGETEAEAEHACQEALYCDTMMTHAQCDRAISEGCRSDQSVDRSSVVETLLMPKIKTIARHCVSCTRDKLQRVGTGFQWLGLDLMVTETLEVKLLECNVSPDISRTTNVKSRLVDAALTAALDILTNSPAAGSGSPEAPYWQLWSAPEGDEAATSVLQFAHSKRLKGGLNKDYLPRKRQVFDRCLALLREKKREEANGEEDESSEDEM